MNMRSKKRNPIILASYASIFGNFILSILKITAGLISGSIAVISDGIDSASDVAISIVMLFTAKIINRPPNKNYVFGYVKAESIATKILSFIIFFAGAQMLISSIKNIIDPSEGILPSSLAIYVTLISIVGKLLLALYQTKVGKKHKSKMLMANGINMRNDVIISISVLVGLVFTFLLKMPILDSITAILVSLFIIKSSISIFLEANIELMDGVKDVSIYKDIFDAIAEIDGAHNPHRVRLRSLGNKYMILLDIEVDGNLSLSQAHNISQKVEKNIRDLVPAIYDIVIHVEPLGEAHQEEAYGVKSDSL